jgi:hypothetical protein
MTAEMQARVLAVIDRCLAAAQTVLGCHSDAVRNGLGTVTTDPVGDR